jgi:hypothetical protein
VYAERPCRRKEVAQVLRDQRVGPGAPGEAKDVFIVAIRKINLKTWPKLADADAYLSQAVEQKIYVVMVETGYAQMFFAFEHLFVLKEQGSRDQELIAARERKIYKHGGSSGFAANRRNDHRCIEHKAHRRSVAGCFA